MPDFNGSLTHTAPRATLAQLRTRLAVRLGYAAQAATGMLPPGFGAQLDDLIQSAQTVLYRRYPALHTERWWRWPMPKGQRFYALDGAVDAGGQVPDPLRVTWAGISRDGESWRLLLGAVDPLWFGSTNTGIPSHYAIRQQIEVWPAPDTGDWTLRLKAHAGLAPLVKDDDLTTLDPEAVFLLAFANAKAHERDPDADNYASQANGYVHSLIAGTHTTRRYVPGEPSPPPPLPRPVRV